MKNDKAEEVVQVIKKALTSNLDHETAQRVYVQYRQGPNNHLILAVDDVIDGIISVYEVYDQIDEIIQKQIVPVFDDETKIYRKCYKHKSHKDKYDIPVPTHFTEKIYFTDYGYNILRKFVRDLDDYLENH